MKLWDPLFKSIVRASLVVQWLRIHLAMQETWVRSLVWAPIIIGVDLILWIVYLIFQTKRKRCQLTALPNPFPRTTHRTTETEQDPVGPSWGTKALLCPPFIVCRKKASATYIFSPKDRFKQWLIRGKGKVGKKQPLQLNSLTQLRPTLCNAMECTTSGLPVHLKLPEFTQTHVHWVGDAIQPSHTLSSPSPRALNLSQHQGLFKWVSSLDQVAKVLEFQLQHQSFQWTPRTDLL